MKLSKPEKRKNGTRRIQSIPEGVSMTDPSDANLVDINNIMLRYQKTGLLPQFKEKLAQYIDTTQIPSYMEAHEQMVHAKELFMQLPSPVRKMMDNDPAKLEDFVKNPENKDILYKYNILDKPKPDDQIDSKVGANPSPNPASDSAQGSEK